MSTAKTPVRKRIAENRRARFEYEFVDTYEAGVVLVGSEVKALREGRANLTDAFAAFEGTELFLRNLHISEYKQANQFNHEPRRSRKLLMHRLELTRLRAEVRETGYALIPTELYFLGSKVKVELVLAKGKKLHDKREDMAERDAKREMARAMRR